jgi:hypothetical protein
MGFDAKLRRHNQNFRRSGDNRDRHQILEDVVGQRGMQRRISDDGRIREHDGVAVGRGAGDIVDAHDAAGPWAVLDHDGLMENFTKLLRQRAPNKLDDASRRVGKDQMDRPRRKILRGSRRHPARECYHC